MKSKSLVLIILVLIPILLTHSSSDTFNIVTQEIHESQESKIRFHLPSRVFSFTYISHPAIVINSDEDFSNYSFSGLGTEDQPFLIENYNITTTESSAVLITNTTKFFTIRYCLLISESYGIYLNNVSFGSGLLEYNNCSFNEIGIYCKQTNGISVSENTCSNNSLSGIYLHNSTNLTVSNNFCSGNQESGIFLEFCLYSEIQNNYASNNGYRYYTAGIRALRTNNTLITNNTCINNDEKDILCNDVKDVRVKNNYVLNEIRKVGIHISRSSYVEIFNNTVTSSLASILIYHSPHLSVSENELFITGLSISDEFPDYLLEYEVKNNNVNGYKLGFFLDAKRIDIQEPIYGQIIIVNGYKITIKNQLETSDFCGITLYNCNKVTMSDLQLTPTKRINKYGIRILHCKNIRIINSIIRNYGRGIHFYESSKSIVKSCKIENSKVQGIFVYYSESINLINNTLRDNHWGDMGLDYSDYCEIEYNIFLSHSYGISYPGLRLDYSSFNIIHHNAFIGNESDDCPQAMDLGGENTWYQQLSSEGNYYSDWSGSGPYDIWTASWDNITDPYPLSKIPIYSDFNYKNFYYFFLVLVIFPAYGIFRAGKFLKEIRID